MLNYEYYAIVVNMLTFDVALYRFYYILLGYSKFLFTKKIVLPREQHFLLSNHGFKQ